MNRKDLIRKISEQMRKDNVRKTIVFPKKVFHISDDEGNHKNFAVNRASKELPYTINDIDAVIEATLTVIKDALKEGDTVTVQGFGTLGLKYRKKRRTKRPLTDEWVDVEARYIPKFSFGNDLRMCAKLYELSLDDKYDQDTDDNEGSDVGEEDRDVN